MAGHAQLKFVGMLEDTNSLDAPHVVIFVTLPEVLEKFITENSVLNLIQLILFLNFEMKYVYYFFRSAIYNNSDVKQYVDALMTRAVRPICNLLQICGHNRARQRDKWAHILDDLVNLQDEVRRASAYC